MEKGDIEGSSGEEWYYSKQVKDHFFDPQNFTTRRPEEGEFDGEGEVGSVVCGDVMKMWIKIDQDKESVKDLKWQTWGCATAIASTSMFSVMVLENEGMKLEDALKIKPGDIMERLGGLPARKVHCSVLADQAFHEAVKDYRKRSEKKS